MQPTLTYQVSRPLAKSFHIAWDGLLYAPTAFWCLTRIANRPFIAPLVDRHADDGAGNRFLAPGVVAGDPLTLEQALPRAKGPHTVCPVPHGSAFACYDVGVINRAVCVQCAYLVAGQSLGTAGLQLGLRRRGCQGGPHKRTAHDQQYYQAFEKHEMDSLVCHED
jgi:hypothetical protein